eukprot:TRINITY_DN750_c0_g1_i11.p1 TRINITY_DN750_c0_g1~~TRINITY_DN750_c0_g1_i11.p1  ORF type:complete len:260 (-),score=63.37 TRINITY_DN750_c0_g1_i11:136-915(-)
MCIRDRHLGVDCSAVFGQDVLTQMDNPNPKQQHLFIINFKTVWADNGDYISKHYAGTGSVISSVTRTGKPGLFGLLDHGMKTLNRFYIGNFEDQIKQECIDLLLGQHTDTANVFAESVERELKIREREFCTYSDLSVLVATWNVGGFLPGPIYDLSELLETEGNGGPDIVVFGFQELVDLNAKNVLVSSNVDTVTSWQSILVSNVKKLDRYNLVRVKDLVGIVLFVFAKDSIKDRISRIEYDTVKTCLLYTSPSPRDQA